MGTTGARCAETLPKYIFLFIGDGMAETHVRATGVILKMLRFREVLPLKR